MTDIRFYHLQQKKLEQALPEILSKALERGMRAVVKAGSKESVEALDAALWTYDPEVPKQTGLKEKMQMQSRQSTGNDPEIGKPFRIPACPAGTKIVG